MAIVSHKVQTTRHRIKAFLNGDNYQVVISDTPGIIDPKYKLHQKMMVHVKSALEDADLALLLQDITLPPESFELVASMLKLKVPGLLLLNKTDLLKIKEQIAAQVALYKAAFPKWEILGINRINP